MRWVSWIVVLVTLAACGAQTSGPDGSTSGACKAADEPSCTRCCTTSFVQASCEGTHWACPATYVDEKTCTQSCAPLPSTKKVCVNRDAGVCLPCGGGEFCISAFRCVPGGDGGTDCGDAPDAGALADDRCHGLCNTFDQCGGTEKCTHTPLPIGCSGNSTATEVCL